MSHLCRGRKTRRHRWWKCPPSSKWETAQTRWRLNLTPLQPPVVNLPDALTARHHLARPPVEKRGSLAVDGAAVYNFWGAATASHCHPEKSRACQNAEWNWLSMLSTHRNRWQVLCSGWPKYYNCSLENYKLLYLWPYLVKRIVCQVWQTMLGPYKAKITFIWRIFKFSHFFISIWLLSNSRILWHRSS